MNEEQLTIDDRYEQQIRAAYGKLQEDVKNMGEQTCKEAGKKGLKAAAITMAVVLVVGGLSAILNSMLGVTLIIFGTLLAMCLTVFGSDAKGEVEMLQKTMNDQVEAALKNEESIGIPRQ